MKKNIKIISLASTALLALAPIAASTVNAADTGATSIPAVAASNTNTQNTQTTAATNTNQSSTTSTQAAANQTAAFTAEYAYDGKTQQVDLDGQVLQVAANSTFDPTNVTLTNGGTVKVTPAKDAKISVDSNTVDTSKAGSNGTVKLTITDNAGKTTSVSYQVFVKPEGLFQLHLSSSYQIGLGDTDTVYQGEEYYITNNLRYEENAVHKWEFFSGISNQSQNATNNSVKWLATKYLLNSKSGNSGNNNTSSTVPAKTETLPVMHTALLYDKNGKSLGQKYYAYRRVTINTSAVTIDGIKYCKLANQDAYIKATNIWGTPRMLTKNAYIYSTSTRRTSHNGAWKLLKGQTVMTYGGSYRFKNGKRYYRIGGPAKQYVRTANF